jgi:outer membrane immunogenic protein
MKRIASLCGLAALLSTAGVAAAADAPAYEPPVQAVVPSGFSWSGPYVGAQVGYAWADADNRANGFSPGSKPDGFMFGAFAGYNHQFDGSPMVAGVETDFNFSDVDAKRGTAAFTGLPDSSIRNESGFNGSVRARLGFTFDRFLIYGAGGLAYADHQVKARGAAGGSDDTIAVGWTVGGGVEAAISDNVTARVEYRYSDYGTDSFSVANTRVKSDLTDNRVMLGVGYKFSTGW